MKIEHISLIFLILLCMVSTAEAADFNSTWNTSKAGVSNSTTIVLPLESIGTYDFTVNWGDGNSSYITAWDQANVTHTYASEGDYDVSINGTIIGFRFNYGGDRLKILNITNWGDLRLGNSGAYFYVCSNLNVGATDVLDLTGTTNFYRAFRGCSGLTTLDVSGWDTSNVDSFSYAFRDCSGLTALDVSGWNVGNVTTFSNTFSGCSGLTTLDVSGWNVGNVTTFYNTFSGCSGLTTLDVSGWNVGNVTTFYNTFRDCSGLTTLDGIGDWNVSTCTEFSFFLSGATLTTTNYDSLLNGWTSLPTLSSSESFHGGNSKYACANASRNVLIDTWDWTITDGGFDSDYICDFVPTNIQTNPSQCCVNISWDAVEHADKYSIYELEDGFPFVITDPVIDGVKDVIYDHAHKFLIFSPNPVDQGDYETIYPVRTASGAYLLIESIDNDDKLGDDDTIYYFDLDNNNLTVDDPAWKITNNIVKKYLWDGSEWKVTGVSDAVGASTNAGTHSPIHELFIPVAELGGNWTNESTVKVLVKREDSSLSPDVITYYPYGNINDTDSNLWQEIVLNTPDSYTWVANTTNTWYNATGLTSFTIYHGAISAWNGTDESEYALFNVITDDLPTFSVSGYISDVHGNPIPEAIVYSCNGFVTEITTSNVSGYWIGHNFRNQTYTVCANKTGYVDNSIIVNVTGNLTDQNIILTTVLPIELWNKLIDIEIQNEMIYSNVILLQLMCVLNFILIIAVWRRKEQ